MCLLVLAWQVHPQFPLLLAGNRDEFHDRPAEAAQWWEEAPEVVAGRDLQAGGTWLGARRDGRWAVVTNFREPLEERAAGARSRGALVTDFLLGRAPPLEFAALAARDGADYGGFNLLAGDRHELAYVSNRGRGPEALGAGVHGLSNHLLDTPWPQLERTRARVAALLEGEPSVEALLAMLADATPAADAELPRTGLPLELERLLSSPFIASPRYGTRCSTVLRLSAQGAMDFTERRYAPDGSASGASAFAFDLEDAG
jgi:uncharacterized protein with NRDE domain